MKNIYIFSSSTKLSLNTAEEFIGSIGDDLQIQKDFSEDLDLVLVFGGDGTFLRAVQACNYSKVPLLGINTGHLGFFQEFTPEDREGLVKVIEEGQYKLQPYRLLEIELETENGAETYFALNDIYIKEHGSGVVHLTLSVGDNFVERFNGDGIVVASSAGSTAYNYSLHGAVVDPRLEALQLTPIAPINNKVYRSFTSSLLFPPQLGLRIEPGEPANSNIGIFSDGREIHTGEFRSLTVTLSEKVINVVRSMDYDFWGKVESKFL